LSNSSQAKDSPAPPHASTNHPAVQYAQDVVDGTIPACKYIILACKRYLRMVEIAEAREWYFDADAAQRVIDFSGYVTPSQGEWAGKPLVLLPWQQFILWNIFGWFKSDGTRLFREAYVEIPRKNGKSTFASIIGLFMLMADHEPGSQVYCAATKKDQAKIIWDEAVLMVKASPALSKHLKPWQTAITHPASNSKFLPLSSDDDKMSGLNIHCGLIDELHEHPNRKVYDIIITSLGTRRQPLIFSITTSGWDRETICWKQHDYGVKILEQIFDDEGSQSFFVYIACLDEGANWQDEKEWFKANPSLGANKKLDYMRRAASKAKQEPAAQNSFLRYELNVWTQQDSRYIPMDKWDLCSGDPDPYADHKKLREDAELRLLGREAFGGLDLATTTDIAAYALLFPPCHELSEMGPDPDDPKKKKMLVLRAADPKWTLLIWFWIPRDNIQKRAERDRVPYDLWEREEIVYATDGNVIDYDHIHEKIKELGTKYSVQEIAFDPYNATQIVAQLTNDGFLMVQFRQGDVSMNTPTKELLRLVLTGDFVHLANPALRWMADNLVVREGPTGLLKPDKERSTEKIDGIVALIMALGRAQAHAPAEDFDAGDAIFVA